LYESQQNPRQLPSLPLWEVSLEEKAKDTYKLLQEISIIGLVGMGGIGKTTLSKKIYHLFQEQYDKSSFLEDVKSKNIEDLKKQLLQDLCGRKKNSMEVVNCDDLKGIEQTMIFEKVLVVIDDVDEKLINDLSKVLAFQGKNKKSNVIVTCRNWGVLEGHLDPNGRFVVPYLEKKQAMELFLSHAFHNTKQVEEGFENIVEEIVETCAGLPLSLEVMGGFLHKKKSRDMQTRLKIWKGALKKLQAGNNLDGGIEDRLWKSLEISYKDLDQPEKDMFLDIACYFGGWKEIIALRIWDSKSSTLELQNLKDRSLVKVNEDGNLSIHDQLRDMGRKFVIREEKNRIWDLETNLQYFHEEVPSRLQGLSWEGNENLVSRIFKNVHLPKLRLFDMAQVSSNIVEDFLHDQHVCELRWIHWQEAKMKEIPFNFGHCPNLRVLDLSKCINLKVLPTSIENLTTLQHFNLSMCSNLQVLPTSINKLIALQELDLSNCSQLKELPTSIDKLTALQSLNLSRCSQLKELPTSIDKLTALQNLYLSRCSQLKELPTSIDKLTALRSLNLSECSQLKELPTSIDKLTALQSLNLSECSELKELPTSIDKLICLENLNLSRCSKLKELPTSIDKLITLSIVGFVKVLGVDGVTYIYQQIE
jgi:Leucine-rich repeat (LRR) protein